MTPEQLHELGRRCATPRSAHAYLDRLIAAAAAVNPDFEGKTTRRPVYNVERKGDDMGRDYVSTWYAAPRLLGIAGLGPRIAELRRQHELQPPENSRFLVRGSVWVLGVERAPTDEDPDVQALACLRLLRGNQHMVTEAWIVPLVRERLFELLVTYPALMHPRLSWSWANIALSDPDEPLPMGHALLVVRNAHLPVAGPHVTDDQLRDFAAHPAVGMALSAKVPKKLHALPASLLKYANQDFLYVLHYSQSDDVTPLLDSVLRVTRLRAEATGESCYLDNEAGRSVVLDQVEEVFTASWTKPSVPQLPLFGVTGPFLREMRLSPGLVTAGFAQRLASQAAQIFYDFTSTWSAAPDIPQRLGRLHINLVLAGAASSNEAAGRMTVRSLFPLPSEGGSEKLVQETCSVEDACAVIDIWEAAGVGRFEVEERVKASKQSRPIWSTAVEMMCNHQRMTDIIAATGATAHAASPISSTASARRNRAI